ncbi:hypothetical protein ACLRDC_06710 [Gluconacetobacter sacchari]
MQSQPSDRLFRNWIKNKLQERFSHVIDEPLPETIRRELVRLENEPAGKADDTS